jgi:hypothetical protein
MLMKIKKIGETISGLTNNNIYTVIAIDAANPKPQAYIFNDNGVLYKTNPINDSQTNQWEIVSVEYGNCVQVYP